jgi:hypothetical protein
MLNGTQILRAAVSAAVFAGVGFALTQGKISMEALGYEAGIQAGAALVSDIVHLQTAIVPSDMTSAAITGGLCAGAKYFLRNDPNLIQNAGISAAVDYGTNMVVSAVGISDSSA